MLTPSYVSFSDTERRIGDAAMNQAALNPCNTLVLHCCRHISRLTTLSTSPSVFEVKRLIGRKFSDLEVQSDVKYFPFKVIDKAGKPYIKVQYHGKNKEFVSSIISTDFNHDPIFVFSLPKKYLP